MNEVSTAIANLAEMITLGCPVNGPVRGQPDRKMQ
jgi:hypothetical protein